MNHNSSSKLKFREKKVCQLWASNSVPMEDRDRKYPEMNSEDDLDQFDTQFMSKSGVQTILDIPEVIS